MHMIEIGIYIGKVYDVDQTSPTDIYYIKRENDKDLMIPARKEFIKNIDIKENKMLIDVKGLDK